MMSAVFFQFPLLLPGVDPREGGARGGGEGGQLTHGVQVLYQVLQVLYMKYKQVNKSTAWVADQFHL